MSLEHPYRGIYLDQQLRNGSSHLTHRRRRPQATRMARQVTWVERIFASALILAAACSLLLAMLLAVGLIWAIGLGVQEIVRWWRG